MHHHRMVFVCSYLIIAIALMLRRIPAKTVQHPFPPAFRYTVHRVKYCIGRKFFEIAYGIR